MGISDPCVCSKNVQTIQIMNSAKILFVYLRYRLQNSPYFCVFKYARAVKQKVWKEARGLRARKTLTPRFTDVFTDFEKKTDCFEVYLRREKSGHGGRTILVRGRC